MDPKRKLKGREMEKGTEKDTEKGGRLVCTEEGLDVLLAGGSMQDALAADDAAAKAADENDRQRALLLRAKTARAVETLRRMRR